MTDLAPHQNRVVEEKRDLDEKISKLGSFFGTEIHKTLDAAEQARLSEQHTIMQTYSRVLGDRINAF